MSVRLAAATTAMVAAAAAVLSWAALSWVAAQAGVDPRLAWLWPVAVDGAIATGTVAAVALRSARLRVRAWSWCVLGGGVLISVAGNGAHAAPGSPLHRVAAAVPALALAASLHLLTVLARQQETARTPTETPAVAQNRAAEDATSRATSAPAEVPSARQRRHQGRAGDRAKAVDRGRRLSRLLRRRPDASTAEVAVALGVSRRTAQRLLAEARRPRVVEEVGR